MSAPLLNEAEGPGSLVLPQLTPHSFASLPDAFCAALSVVSTLLKVLEELYAICQIQQQRLEDKPVLSTPDLSVMYTVHSEQKHQERKQQEQKQVEQMQQERRHGTASLASRQLLPKDDEHRKVLCRLKTVLQAARLLNCNAEQYDHLLPGGQLALQFIQSPCSVAPCTTLDKDSRSTPYVATNTKEKELCAVGAGERLSSTPQTTPGELLLKGDSYSRTTSRGGTCRDKETNIQDAATGVAPEASETLRRRRRSQRGSTGSNDYELSVCKALLMLQQLDLHDENVCSEEEVFFTLEDCQTRQQQTACDVQNYACSALQKEAFYDVLQKEVEKRQAPLFTHEQQNPWQYSAEDSRWHQQLQKKQPLSLQSILAAGAFIRLDKAVILEMLLRIKMLREAQRMLRADIIMLRHQYFVDGQTLRLFLQQTVTTRGLERKALLSRLQQVAALLQNK